MTYEEFIEGINDPKKIKQVNFYIEGYNHEFDLSDFEFWSHNMSEVFPFKNIKSYYRYIRAFKRRNLYNNK